MKYIYIYASRPVREVQQGNVGTEGMRGSENERRIILDEDL